MYWRMRMGTTQQQIQSLGWGLRAMRWKLPTRRHIPHSSRLLHLLIVTLFSLWIVYQGRSSLRRHASRSRSRRNGRLSLVLFRHPALPRKLAWRKPRMKASLQLKLNRPRCVTFTVIVLALTDSGMKGLKNSESNLPVLYQVRCQRPKEPGERG